MINPSESPVFTGVFEGSRLDRSRMLDRSSRRSKRKRKQMDGWSQERPPSDKTASDRRWVRLASEPRESRLSGYISVSISCVTYSSVRSFQSLRGRFWSRQGYISQYVLDFSVAAAIVVLT